MYEHSFAFSLLSPDEDPVEKNITFWQPCISTQLNKPSGSS